MAGLLPPSIGADPPVTPQQKNGSEVSPHVKKNMINSPARSKFIKIGPQEMAQVRFLPLCATVIIKGLLSLAACNIIS